MFPIIIVIHIVVKKRHGCDRRSEFEIVFFYWDELVLLGSVGFVWISLFYWEKQPIYCNVKNNPANYNVTSAPQINTTGQSNIPLPGPEQVR